MFDRFSLGDLTVRVLGAPMAGGPSTPALAAAVSNGGGLGFLAGGLCSADELADSILAARRLSSGPLGVNLFVPQARVATVEELGAFAAALAEEAEHYGVALGEPRDADDEYAAKLDVVCDLRPEVVSFTFGPPSDAACIRLCDAGILTLATVTTVREALIANSFGVSALVAQGPDAGGHRATFDPIAAPAADPLDDLISALVACFDCPVVAAGGLATPAAVRRAQDAGAAAVQIGTAFLLADEAGTNPVHRAALRDPQFTQTVVTRAFTGRYARALRNGFIDRHDAHSVFGFPQAAMITGPIQAAAVKLGDPHGVGMWTGAGFRDARTGSATDIVQELAGC
ncbi:nitronate monooxygenase [Mycobacterium sp. 050272]|uniref:nitronate monooxygenase n=1 Tax=Mycobacterium sp. 050272 TaxID=3142488 RepID=UPI0031910F58